MSDVLLFIDMLGVRARWHRGGRPDAELAFKDFRNLVAGALKNRTPVEVTHGIIETDAVALTCSDVRIALDVGKRLYQMAFEQTGTNKSRRYWFRGVIVPRLSSASLKNSGHFVKPLGQIEIAHYEPELFDAIAIEKVGHKGNASARGEDATDISNLRGILHKGGPLSFIPFKRLRSSYYPRNIADTHIDYLWMVRDKHEDRSKMDLAMASRLRLAALDAEEFSQAAATQVVFHESAAMIGSIETRLSYQQRRKLRKHLIDEVS